MNVNASGKTLLKLMTFISLIIFIARTQVVQQPVQLASGQITTQKIQSPHQANKQFSQASSQGTVNKQLPYTENIQQFKSKKYNQRLQTVVGCWLLSKEYLELYKSDYLFYKNQQLKELVTLRLVKECMKRIPRKDAVVKITELVGKNMQPAKKYEEVIQKDVIDAIFIEVNKQNIANYNEVPQNPNEEIIINTASSNQHNKKNSQSINPDNSTLQNYKLQESIKANRQDKASINSLSQFDTFLVQLIKKYDLQFNKLRKSKQGIRGKVQEQLKKRQKYYFGFIPASSFTHSVFLVTISLSMVFCCTCYKYYKMRSNQKGLKGHNQEDQSSHSHSHSHSHHKQGKKIAKMSQLTMKRKAR